MEKLNMKDKLMKDKKGVFPQMFVFLIVIGVLFLLFFGLGGVSGFILKTTLKNIPPLFWVGLIIFIFIVLGGKKKK